MIDIKNLTLNYSEKSIIKDFNLTVHDNEIVAIIGPSGIGKTTIIKAISGLKTIDHGSIILDNHKSKEEVIGWIPQNYGLLPFKTVEQNINLNLKIINHKVSAEDKFFSKQIAEQLHIEDLMKKYPLQLSGGQQQRVAIARAFSMKSDILLMDEPFSALDPLTREEVQQLFYKLWLKQRSSALLVTHDINEAVLLANRIVVLSINGEIQDILDNSQVVKLPIENRKFSPLTLEVIKKLTQTVKELWKTN